MTAKGSTAAGGGAGGGPQAVWSPSGTSSTSCVSRNLPTQSMGPGEVSEQTGILLRSHQMPRDNVPQPLREAAEAEALESLSIWLLFLSPSLES